MKFSFAGLGVLAFAASPLAAIPLALPLDALYPHVGDQTVTITASKMHGRMIDAYRPATPTEGTVPT